MGKPPDLKYWPLFVHLHIFLSPYVNACSLSSENELFLVLVRLRLVRLRLGLLLEDIADRFKISLLLFQKCYKNG